MDGRFSTTHHNLPSYIQSMDLVMGKVLLEPTSCLRMETYVELLSQIHLLTKTNQVVPESIMTHF